MVVKYVNHKGELYCKENGKWVRVDDVKRIANRHPYLGLQLLFSSIAIMFLFTLFAIAVVNALTPENPAHRVVMNETATTQTKLYTW